MRSRLKVGDLASLENRIPITMGGNKTKRKSTWGKLTSGERGWRHRLAKRYRCPCCDNFTLDEKPTGSYDICPICFWEDDPVQYHDPDFDGAANEMSLNQARANYRLFGATDEEHLTYVRKPLDVEKASDTTGLSLKEVRALRNHRGVLPRIWYLPFILLLVGIIASVYGGILLTSSSSFVKNAESAYGRIVSEQWVNEGPERVLGEGPLRMVTVEFKIADSARVVSFEIGDSQLRVGQSVEVIYDPLNPDRAEIKGGSLDLFGAVFLLAVGIAFLVWGVLSLVL